jgi:hypothetical protein
MRHRRWRLALAAHLCGLLVAVGAALAAPAQAANGVIPMGTALPRATSAAKHVTVADTEITLSASQRLIFVELYADW